MFKNTLLFLFLPILANAQLKEFEAEPLQRNENVIQGSKDFFDNVLILVYSSLDNLQFRSSLDVINKQGYNAQLSRYEILAEPRKQMIYVSASGYMQLLIATINPNPKDVLYFKVEEKMSEKLSGRGTLGIDTDPEGARILLNELELAQTTPAEIPVPAGVNRLQLLKNRYQELDTVLRVRKDEKLILDLALKPAWADLTVTTGVSNARIYLDGKQLASGSLSLTGISKGLEPGTYDLRVELDKHRPFQKSLRLNPAGVENINAKLTPITGSLNVRSTPPGADIMLDGQKVGQTPYQKDLMIGDYEVVVDKKGFKEETRRFSIGDGTVRDFDLNLTNYSKAINPLQAAKWTFFGITMAGLGTGGYFLYSSISGYEAYGSATVEAESLRKQVQTADVIYPIAFAVAGAALIPTIIFHSKIRKKKREWGLAAVPTEGGGVIGLTHNF